MRNITEGQKLYEEHMKEIHGPKVSKRKLVEYFKQIYWPFNFTEEELKATLQEYEEKHPGYSRSKFGLEQASSGKK